MNRPRSQDCVRLMLLIVGLVAGPCAFAALHRLPVRTTPTNALVRLPASTSPEARCPVDNFREFFVLTPEERNDYLDEHMPNATSEARKRMLAKAREYESLSPEQRELRLRVTELRWYLWPMLKTPATNRAAWLGRIRSEEDRRLVEDRLRHWDKLSPQVQKELLENEATLRYFTELNAGTEEGRSNILRNLSPERRRKLEAGIQNIRQMPEEERQKMMTRFAQFFDLSPAEKTKALSILSDPDRRQIDKALKAFSTLPSPLRTQCIQSFERFVKMSLAERQLFLKNAERWKLMSPQERQDWCDLVASMSNMPPLPPGLEEQTGDSP
jgi:hypothetical protein